MTELYIGLMSGTSVDGIDAALVDFESSKPQLLATHFEKMPSELRKTILEICQPGLNEINRMGELDVVLGKQFAKTVNLLLEKNNISASEIRAIGSHGQTIRHHPDKHFTLQVGDPNVIAAETGITTIADFRRRDMAYGGQGAPLVPAFHQSVFADKNVNRVIVNIGGIANITLLPANLSRPTSGFDTGPGNTLLDAWAEIHLQKPCDEQGIWASQGKVNTNLLNNLLNDPFFKLPAPKSSGREYFNLSWLESYLSLEAISAVDVQTTLVELTATSIINEIKAHLNSGELLVCGGGIHNQFLMQRLKWIGSTYHIESTQKLGIDPDWVEAVAFAWLAKQTIDKKPGNLTEVTGANKNTILGGVYFI
jgi:anhydro-N-acetylmuramic acid kinase